MDCLRFILSIFVCLVAGYVCIPSVDFHIYDSFNDDINCSEVMNCTEVYKPVCGSDGVTYDSLCHLNEVYQRNVCELGNFNPIAFVRNGNCTDGGDDDDVYAGSDVI